MGLGSLASAGLSVSAEGGYLDLTNSHKSASAVLGSSGGGAFGGELGYDFGRSVFVSLGARYFDKTGQRVFVASPTGGVFPLGHPLEVRIVPVFATLGYRFRPRGSFAPYAGAGGGILSYHEQSTVAGIADSQDLTKPEGHVLLGLEFGRQQLRVGLEVVYSLVPNAVGLGGVSKVYGEKDLGGLTVLGKLSLGGRR